SPRRGGSTHSSGELSCSLVRRRLLGTYVGGDEAGKNRALQVWAQNFLAETGYLDELRRSEKEPETAENRVRNLQELEASMDDGEREMLPPPERLQSFLEELALDGDREDEKENPGDAVTLITMHSCKGQIGRASCRERAEER